MVGVNGRPLRGLEGESSKLASFKRLTASSSPGSVWGMFNENAERFRAVRDWDDNKKN